jgi:hypothetical protein
MTQKRKAESETIEATGEPAVLVVGGVVAAHSEIRPLSLVGLKESARPM